MMDAPSELRNPNQLALAMLEWHSMIQQAIELEALIGETILNMDKPKTVITGLVRATLNSPRKKYDKKDVTVNNILEDLADLPYDNVLDEYELLIQDIIDDCTKEEIIPEHVVPEQVNKTTDWNAITKELIKLGILAHVGYTEGKPSVTLKIEKE